MGFYITKNWFIKRGSDPTIQNSLLNKFFLHLELLKHSYKWPKYINVYRMFLLNFSFVYKQFLNLQVVDNF